MATQAAATREQGNFKHWRLERDLDGIAWLYIDRYGEKVNSLSSEILGELGEIVDLFEQDAPTGLVLMSGKPGSFIVGADVREFDATTDVELLRDSVRDLIHLRTSTQALQPGWLDSPAAQTSMSRSRCCGLVMPPSRSSTAAMVAPSTGPV